MICSFPGSSSSSGEVSRTSVDEGSGREAVCGPWEILDQRNSAAEPQAVVVAAAVAAVSFCSVSSLP